MQDYHVYAHYSKEQASPPTSPQHTKSSYSKLKPISEMKKEKVNSKANFRPAAVAGSVMLVAGKINQYVGEITENRVTARRFQVGITFGALAMGIVKNPVIGTIATVGYVANAGIQYGIKNYKENLSADYMKQLSGGTVNKR